MAEEMSQSQVEFAEGRYSARFEQVGRLDQGASGTVFKARDKSTNEIYAIKKIWLKDPKLTQVILRELNAISRMKSEFTVRYISTWRDDDFVYIQMELCQGDLSKVLTSKAQAFGRGQDQRLNSLEFYISCEILKELTEALNYLHSLDPIIMHRDLKPANVLVTNGHNGRFIKLCDFGLSKDYENSSNTRYQGTGKYIAPENKFSRKYNFQADIFSLAVIALELFGIEYREGQVEIDCNQVLAKYLGTNLENSFKQLLESLNKCIKENTPYNERPTCAEFLAKIKDWSIDKSVVKNDNEFNNNIEKLNNSNNEFLIKYTKNKLAL